MDYLRVLLRALAAQGLHYRVAARNTNFSGTFPLSSTEAASLTDHDVLPVREGVKVTHAASANYDARITLPAADGSEIVIPEGYASAVIEAGGRRAKVTTTHPESYSTAIRDAQTAQLNAWLKDSEGSDLPNVVLGDFNDRNTDTTGSYQQFLDAGYGDAYTDLHGSTGGWTAGQDDSLAETPSALDHRVDFVFYQRGRLRPLTARTVGDTTDQMTRTPVPLWPSDHAGLIATFAV
ncbi:endonuclease/exonuclease/phosphatase family protein [Streptomyces sp. NPDC046909]|uniref:endonuclease/exonuclease/phosphatase family protein n=1 Tax=Streptomyces sp. NPDC046909 TaxID=3155617 RepID=UPI0033FF157E